MVKDCCKDSENLKNMGWLRLISYYLKRFGHLPKKGMSISVCCVCGCKHFKLKVDEGVLGLVGKGVGR